MESFELVKRRAPRGSTLVFARRGFDANPGNQRVAGGHVVRAGQTAIVPPSAPGLGGKAGRVRPPG
ncbi:hypothetical protein [Caballeronia sp.]|uniref:hypothetical protein n=1 Tax=Caballeronia sp. TaxID=1931223 RepID=UPI003C388898